MRDEEEGAQEERVRSHSTRAALLALLTEGEQGLRAGEIRNGLPDEPDLRSFHYHLRVLEANEMIVKDGDRYKLC